jgi:hypothetical protein
VQDAEDDDELAEDVEVVGVVAGGGTTAKRVSY